MDKDEVREAKPWDVDGHHNQLNVDLVRNLSQIWTFMATYFRCGGISYMEFVYNSLVFFENQLGFDKVIISLVVQFLPRDAMLARY